MKLKIFLLHDIQLAGDDYLDLNFFLKISQFDLNWFIY